MKKRNGFILLLLLHHSLLYAQLTETATAIVKYDFSHVIDTTQPDFPDKQEMVLYLGKQSSFYTGTVTLSRDQQEAKFIDEYLKDHPDVARESFVPPGSPRYYFYKNLESSKLVNITKAYLKNYLDEEELPVIKWQITSESKTIAGYVCQKATTPFHGRVYEAWFCSQLPFNNGPWKLGGLPGLILEASDAKKEVVFTFKSFENAPVSATEKITVALPSGGIKVTKKQLKQFLQAADQNPSITAAATSVLGQMRRPPPGSPAARKKEFNNPIEKE